RPVPTTMTVSRRRLAGLTSRPRNFRSLQRSCSGTSSGALVSATGSPTVNRSRSMGPSVSGDQAERDGQGDDEEAGREQDGDGDREGVGGALPALVALAQGLGGAPDPVAQMD